MIIQGAPFTYKEEGGSFIWYGATGQLSNAVDEIAFLYTDEFGVDPCLLKHGSPALMERRREEMLAAGWEKNFPGDLKIIVFAKGFNLDEINRAIHTSGYLKFLLNPS